MSHGRETRSPARQEPVCKTMRKMIKRPFSLRISESPLGLTYAQRTLSSQDYKEMSVTWLHLALCLPPCDFSRSSIPNWDSGANSNHGLLLPAQCTGKELVIFSSSRKREPTFFVSDGPTSLAPQEHSDYSRGQGQYLHLSVALGALRHSNLNREGERERVVNQNWIVVFGWREHGS